VPALADIDFTDLDNFAAGFPHRLFEIHRREAPVWWHEPTEHTPDGEGFWSVATHAEALEVLTDPQTYSSERGGDRPYGGTLLEDLQIAGLVLNMMDDPRHGQIRRLVSSGLTPRMIRRVEDDLRARVRGLLDGIADDTPLDFMGEVAVEPPMQMICLLLGVPESERHWLLRAVDPGFDYRGSRKTFEDSANADLSARMHAYGAELIEQKRRHPADDMLSVVAGATLGGGKPDLSQHSLTDAELYLFFSLLFTAGAETTKNAIAGGLLALAQHPEQYRRLRAEPGLLPAAIEEIIRWTTPSPAKRRTATRDTRLLGAQIAAGDKVLIWEGSANRDEAVFARPDQFDVTRSPNPHLGFGHGVHFCLGASLARLELQVMFEELLSQFTDVRVAGPVEWTRSNRHTGIRRLPVELSRSR
jgi:cytochrome P450